eukprot:6210856-Pleurochrysis_carterae.AAC.1
MFIVASLHCRSGTISIFGWTMTCKLGHPVATLPSDEGDYTLLVVGHKFFKSNGILRQFQREAAVVLARI